jgi:hypothetical protein
MFHCRLQFLRWMNRGMPDPFRARLQGRFHIELEQMDSADPPLALRSLYGGRYRQRLRHSTEEVHAGVGPRGGDPARLSVFHRSVLVRAAVCSQMAQQAIDPLNGRLAAGPNLNPSGEISIRLKIPRQGFERNRLLTEVTCTRRRSERKATPRGRLSFCPDSLRTAIAKSCEAPW